jgi:hypothetical protein
MIMGGGEVLIWGEPFDRSNLIANLRNHLRPFTLEWPPAKYFVEGEVTDLHEQWVANLYPDFEYLRKAHIAFFSALFRESAEKCGRKRWGIKEVRLGYEDAVYLKWLYPDAKFVFLCRNPLDAYSSYRAFQRWYSHWPERKVITPTQFGAHWRRLTDEFLAHHVSLNGIFVRYEDLGDKSVVEAMEAYLGCTLIRPEALRRLDGRRSESPAHKRNLSKEPWLLERTLLKVAVRGTARKIGYRI